MNLKSYAKINFYLHVGQKEGDLHNIASFAFPISLHDDITIEIEKSGKTIIECDKEEVPCNEDNLCYKAIEVLKKKMNIKWGFKIRIIKRIPMMAGLGGGSSNAATVLRGINDLLGLGLTTKELIEIGKEVGSDVPFFILNKPAEIRGVGDKLRRIKAPLPFWVIIIKPEGGVSTKEAYRLFDEKKQETSIDVYDLLKEGNYQEAFLKSNNDLEEGSKKLCPSISEVEERLSKYGLQYVRMSGSGSSVFALSSNRKELMDIQKELQDVYPFVCVVHPLV